MGADPEPETDYERGLGDIGYDRPVRTWRLAPLHGENILVGDMIIYTEASQDEHPRFWDCGGRIAIKGASEILSWRMPWWHL
jgi:hypothetical protein